MQYRRLKKIENQIAVKKKRPFFSKPVFRVLLALLLIFVFVVISLAIIWFSTDYELNLDDLKNIKRRNVFFDNQNVEIQSDADKYIEISKLHGYTINCFIAKEDKNFFNHGGIDLKRIVKAGFVNMTHFSFKQGASTITQQLIKNTYLGQEKTLSRKYKEIKLALKLEKQMSKEEILELYLNSIYFGKNSYGIENASYFYFNKSAENLTLNESAVLAGIISSPNKNCPIINGDRSMQHRNFVLKSLLHNNYISNDIYEYETTQPIVLNLNEESLNYSYMHEVYSELNQIFLLSKNDLTNLNIKVYTYLDSNLQNKANELLASSDLFDNCYDNINDCIVLIDNQTCGVNVLACNNTLNIKETKRQIGSTIKPILVYMPAMEENIITATTLINDEKTNFGGYSPSNFDDVYYGDVTVRHAIKKSLNIPAVKTLNYLGMDSFFEYADKLDINLNNNDRNLSSALGGLTNGIDLISLTSSYTSLANYGIYNPPKFIKKIEDDKGNILYENVTNFQPVFSVENSFIMTDILMDSVSDGTAHKMDILPFEIAAKTGTVGYDYGNSDAYNISYTTKHTMGIWVGAKKGVISNYISGGNTCSFIARDLYNDIYKGKAPPDFKIPNTVHLLNVDMENLNVNHEITLAADSTPEKFVYKEYFSQNNMPIKVSKYFDNLKVIDADVDIIQKYPNVKFTALPYVIYEVYQLYGDSATLIKTIENKTGDIEVIDNLAIDGKTYRYTVIPYINVKGEKRKLDQGIFTSKKVVMPLKFSPKNSDNNIDNDIENWWDLAL